MVSGEIIDDEVIHLEENVKVKVKYAKQIRHYYHCNCWALKVDLGAAECIRLGFSVSNSI